MRPLIFEREGAYGRRLIFFSPWIFNVEKGRKRTNRKSKQCYCLKHCLGYQIPSSCHFRKKIIMITAHNVWILCVKLSWNNQLCVLPSPRMFSVPVAHCHSLHCHTEDWCCPNCHSLLAQCSHVFQESTSENPSTFIISQTLYNSPIRSNISFLPPKKTSLSGEFDNTCN